MKLFRLTSIFLAITIILFFLVAIVLPSERYFEVEKNISTDPVAIFDRLENHTEDEPWYQNLDIDSAIIKKAIGRNLDEIILQQRLSEPYREIKYLFEVDNKPCCELTFLLQPYSEGTLLTCYMKITDLDYPFGRWRGLFMSGIMRNPLRKYLENLNTNLVE